MNNFLFLGGDLRSLYAARRLGERYDCFIYGFSDLPAPCNVNMLRELTRAGNLVLPLPVSRDGVNINAPYRKADAPMPLSLVYEAVHEGGTVYTGKTCPELERICKEKGLTLIDYFEREELTVMNAMVTAEGTLELMLNQREETIYGARVLITGYGRISKLLARTLVTLGAHVTIAARKFADLAWAQLSGCEVMDIAGINGHLQNFDIIINTVPFQVINNESLKQLRENTLVLDLASQPGIEDIERAKSSGVNIIHALSLPGKTAPVTAGYIVADTIMNIIQESSGGAT